MSEQPHQDQPQRHLSRTTNLVKVATNYAISGQRNSPFENVEPRRLFSGRAKKIALSVGVVAAGAALTVASIFTIRGIGNAEKSSNERNASTQEALRNQLNQVMIDIDENALTAWRSGKSDLQESFPAPGQVEFADDTTAIIMGTRTTEGAGSHTPDRSAPLLATWENNTGTGPGTIGTQFTIVSPAGNADYNRGIGFIDFYGSTGGGWGAVNSNADTTNNSSLSGMPTIQAAQEIASDAKNFPPEYNT